MTPVDSERLDGGGERILFVDDDSAVAQIACRLLENLGYRPEFYIDATRALANLRREWTRWDLVIVDWAMPEIDGVEFAVQLGSFAPELPVLLTTGEVAPPAQLPPNVRGMLTKPFTKLKLAHHVHQSLADTSSSR